MLSGCNSTDPIINSNRTTLEYEWEVDTLQNPYNYGVVPWSMWGSSPSTIWAVGFNTAGQGEIYHYNGSIWIRVTPNFGFNYEVLDIVGFSPDEVYAVGSKIIKDTTLRTSSLILRFNGNGWQVEDIEAGSGLVFIHGYDSNNIWACGINGTLYKKSGASWNKIHFDSNYNLGPIWVSLYGNPYLMYIDNTGSQDTVMFYFANLANSRWEVLDSCKLVTMNGYRTGYKFGEKRICETSSSQIYSVGRGGIFNHNGNDWELIFWDDYEYKDIKMNQEGNAFAVGNHGTITYSINNEWKRISEFAPYTVDFYSIMPFNKDIYVGGYASNKGYIIHGRLKE